MAFQTDPSVLMIAEESTAWPLVTRPLDGGGLGFNLKWNMGWMNDMCHYLKLDPYFRQYNHKDITFSMMYAFSENFVLPISHDEVVHMKGSIVGKMPGDYDNQLRCLRGFYAYLLAHPGKKLLFMGAEIGQWHEWDSTGSWTGTCWTDQRIRSPEVLPGDQRLLKKTAALWEVDFDWAGFEWLVPDDNHNNVVVFLRRDKKGRDLMCAVNFSPNTYTNYRMGVPPYRRYVPVFNTDDPAYGGDGFGDSEAVMVEAVPSPMERNAPPPSGSRPSVRCSCGARDVPQTQEETTGKGVGKDMKKSASPCCWPAARAAACTSSPATWPSPPCPSAGNTASSTFPCPTAPIPASTPWAC